MFQKVKGRQKAIDIYNAFVTLGLTDGCATKANKKKVSL